MLIKNILIIYIFIFSHYKQFKLYIIMLFIIISLHEIILY